MNAEELYHANQWLKANPDADCMDIEYRPAKEISLKDRERLDAMTLLLLGIRFNCPKLTALADRLEDIRYDFRRSVTDAL